MIQEVAGSSPVSHPKEKVMRHYKFCLLFLLLSALPLAAYAEDEADTIAESAEKQPTLTVQVESDIYSRYVWYGTAASNGPVWQPSVSVAAYGLKFTTWANFVMDNEPNQGEFNEVDFILTYQNNLKKLNYVLLVEGDIYPNGNPKSLDYSSATLKTGLHLSYPVGPVSIFGDFQALFVSVQGGTSQTNPGLGWFGCHLSVLKAQR